MQLFSTPLLLGASLVALLGGDGSSTSDTSAATAQARKVAAPGTGGARGGPESGGPEMSQTGMVGPATWSVSAPGADFMQVSTTTRTAGVIATQTCPFALALPALPPGAVVIETFACWNYLTDSAPASDWIDINGNQVQGSLVGAGSEDLCWAKNGAAAYMASGLTPILNLGGVNSIADTCDKSLGTDPAALGEGITFLIVYSVAPAASRTVSVWTGYTSTETSPSGDADALLVLPHPYDGGTAHFFMNALDGQQAGDHFLFNGVPVSGVMAGTGFGADAWVGLAGPLPNDNLYDAASDDVSTLVPLGASALQTSSVKVMDCIGHSFAAFAMDEPCGLWSAYCTAKVNSQGCTPSITASGTPSAGSIPGPFDVKITELINNKPGVLIYGFGPAAIPFQNGLLCIQPPVTRTSLQNTAGNPPPDDCSGSLSFDFNPRIQSGIDPSLVVGATVYAQSWSRDVADPLGTSLSNALRFTICP